jgi:hypothetical protein
VISAKNIYIAIIGTDSEVSVLWTVPLVEYFFHVVAPLTEIKAARPLVGFVTRITLNP